MLAKWIERHIPLNRRQAVFALLLGMVLAVNTVPALRASALELMNESGAADPAAEAVSADRLIIVGAEDGGQTLASGRKVTVTGGGNAAYATTRANETIEALLSRLEITVGPMEMVKVDLTQPEITVEVASSFTYYETAYEASAYTTVYNSTYTLPKGEQQVTQPGVNGTREVIYEVIYADGQLVSRQAVAEGTDTSSAEIVSVGTCVKEAQAGDTIASVVKNDDGSGYLIMKSGDALHFSCAMNVRCTAYTTGYDGVGTRTATGTAARRGCVAVDKRVIPLGTNLFITAGSYTYGMAYAEDTGMRGEKIDLYMDSYNECIQFGLRSAVAYILD